jgi:hypothetical protein
MQIVYYKYIIVLRVTSKLIVIVKDKKTWLKLLKC